MQLHSIYQFQCSATVVSGNMPQFRAVAGLQKNAVVANDNERARYFRKSGFEKSDGKNIQVIGRLIQNKQPERFAPAIYVQRDVPPSITENPSNNVSAESEYEKEISCSVIMYAVFLYVTDNLYYMHDIIYNLFFQLISLLYQSLHNLPYRYVPK